MHEIAIVEGLIGIVEKERQKHKFSKVIEIRIACGPYNCASEENLNFCLRTVSEGTCFAEAAIKVDRLPERWQCPACRIDIIKERRGVELYCPACHSTTLVPLLNSEIYLDKLEVE